MRRVSGKDLWKKNKIRNFSFLDPDSVGSALQPCTKASDIFHWSFSVVEPLNVYIHAIISYVAALAAETIFI